MNDLQWSRHGHDHGDMLARESGATVLRLHYNSGLHVSDNGAMFGARWLARQPAGRYTMEEAVRATFAATLAEQAAAEAALQAGRVLGARDCLQVLVRSHFDVLLGPESDFIPVMLYEWRSLSPSVPS